MLTVRGLLRFRICIRVYTNVLIGKHGRSLHAFEINLKCNLFQCKINHDNQYQYNHSHSVEESQVHYMFLQTQHSLTQYTLDFCVHNRIHTNQLRSNKYYRTDTQLL